jgi:hypothetical protein
MASECGEFKGTICWQTVRSVFIANTEYVF